MRSLFSRSSTPCGVLQAVAATLLAASLAACGGGSDSPDETPVPAVPDTSAPQPPAAPQAPALSLSSYDNKMQAIATLGPLALAQHFSPALAASLLQSNSYAFGDFFGNGSMGLITHTFEYNFDASKQDQLGKVLAFELVNGQWKEKDLQISGGNSGCLHPRKAVVSDFNGDGKADVFFACTGLDLPPFPGERSLLLVQTDSGFDKHFITTPGSNYLHGASAADLNGDGLADLVIANMSTIKQNEPGCEGTAILINQGNLSFRADASLIKDYEYCQTSYSAEFLRLGDDQPYSLLLSGHGSSTGGNMQQPQLFQWKDGQFHADLVLPAVPDFGLVLDAVYSDGHLYALRTMDMDGQFYAQDLIQKIPLHQPAQASIIYEHQGLYPNYNSWINWIGFYQGKLVSLLDEFGLKINK